jgi:hypothetical protein
LVKPAFASEPRKATEPSVLREPGDLTNVIDAFDEDDPFDLSFTLGYQQTWRSASIRRETNSTQADLSSGGYISHDLDVGDYSETTSRLNTRMDVGVYKDIALFFRLPVILSNDRKIDASGKQFDNQELNLQGLPGEQLFNLPFKAPTRSGIEYLAIGLDFGIFNQWRDVTKPTWVFGFEGRFNVSEPLHACNANPDPGQMKCAHPSDIDRDGQSGEFVEDIGSGGDVTLEGTNFSGERAAGVARGTTGLEVHTYLSKRIKYIEPSGGLQAVFEFQNSNSDYGVTDLQGSLVNRPPLEGSMILGLQVMPWEVIENYQRLAIDFRFKGTYRSEGRDYSELFDALGSSNAASLRLPTFAQYQANPDTATAGDTPSVINPNSQKVYVTGITDVQQHGLYTLSTSVTWQGGEYIKFSAGGAYTLVQGHVLTADQPCNPDFTGNLERSGPCRSTTSDVNLPFRATGMPNPNYRAAINAPGRRFRVAESRAFDAWVNATVMF